MIDKIEFSDVKQVRKTLLITSFIGFAFKRLSEHSTGNIEFLGFKIPIDEAGIIPNLIGSLIIFFTIALLIRYFDENLKIKYAKYEEYLKNATNEYAKTFGTIHSPQPFSVSDYKIKSIKVGVILLDLVFPIGFATFTLFNIYFKS